MRLEGEPDRRLEGDDTPEELPRLLQELMDLPSETEWIEFKEARTTYDFDTLGRYFSALSNEANLNDQSAGWLIFGVTDTPPRIIVGSNYCLMPPGLDDLKKSIARQTNHQMTFSDIHEFNTSFGRVIIFEIPPASRGIPTTWRERAYGRIHDSLEPLALHEIERIRNQGPVDWSSRICEGASISDLEPDAISFARNEFKKKYPSLAQEVDRWPDSEFLNRAKISVEGNITNTAIVLLGRTESEHFLSPSIAQITWVLKDESGTERDYVHFGPPLILAVNDVFRRIRNLTYRHISDETLFPVEISQYDSWVIRETLHNCIAHQDYSQGARISIVESPDSLLFTNRGDFIPGSVESLLIQDAPPDRYRNRFLANAMVNLNMIDTIGSGIRRMFQHQRERNFPLPDYDLSEPGRVSVRIIGKVLDPKYTRMLIRRKDLNLLDVIALDKVQKGRQITQDEFRSLKTKGLIEGRRPHLYVSEKVAAETDTRADYIRKRSLDRDYFKKMIVTYLETYHEAKWSAFEDLLLDKVSDALNEKQKRQFIKDLLQEMRRDGTLETIGRTQAARWVLASKDRSS
ncbi:MAG TPA: putative DNA binding domain-containing protein [Methanoregulaceae archaeon]|nr:MAG: putative DNA binding domain-containing protein [Methanolinea sp.]HON82400.1 putative DNA binding domain-containing protein [Methanoregulaceae archaeon]